MKVKNLIKLLNNCYDPEDSVIVGLWDRDLFKQVDFEADWHDLAETACTDADWSKQTEELQNYADQWMEVGE